MDHRRTTDKRRAAAADADDDIGGDTATGMTSVTTVTPAVVLPDEVTKSEVIVDAIAGDYALGPGAMLGEYRILGKAGEGGMGVVYAAVHPMIGKRAAIKVLKKEYCEDPYTVERFIDEARVVNQIGHPNIVDIFAFGEMPNGRSYFVMEWLKGKSLRERLLERRLGLVEVCAILKPLARALQAAHDKGVIHRDLKPDNIFLGDADEDAAIPVKLLDFGIAKLAGREGGMARMERTATGAMIGTPMYIAPEQARGHSVDHRADVYSLGAIAFEMLTGRTPFLADNAMEMVAKHLLESPPTVGSVAPNTPPALDRVVSAMIAKDAAARPTLAALLQVLEGVRLVGTSAPDLASLATTVKDLSASDFDERPSASAIAVPAASRSEPIAVAPRAGGRGKWIALVAGAIAVAIAAFAVTKRTRSAGDTPEPPPAGASTPPPAATPPTTPTTPPMSTTPTTPTTSTTSTASIEAPPKPTPAPPALGSADGPPPTQATAPAGAKQPTRPVGKTVPAGGKKPADPGATAKKPPKPPQVDDNTLFEPGSLKK